MTPRLQENVFTFFAELRESLYSMTFIDSLDVAIMTVFLSFGLMVLQRRTSRSILFAVFPLVFAFIAAKTLNMYLTSKMLQVGILVLTVGIFIVFQEDFRRAFESLSSWRLWGRGKSYLSVKLGDTLTECVFTMAKAKTGALIVIEGREPLDAHLRAGVPLKGMISAPLLFSLFDKHSAGHDGAVIIVNGAVDRFGAHLPLSRNASATGRLGTRHAAALGIVEKCDALVLVVSEETGTVSIGKRGKLVPAESVAQVRDAVRDQSRRLKPSPHRSLLEIPWGRLAASFAISFALWATYARPRLTPSVAQEKPAIAAPPLNTPEPEVGKRP